MPFGWPISPPTRPSYSNGRKSRPAITNEGRRAAAIRLSPTRMASAAEATARMSARRATTTSSTQATDSAAANAAYENSSRPAARASDTINGAAAATASPTSRRGRSSIANKKTRNIPRAARPTRMADTSDAALAPATSVSAVTAVNERVSATRLIVAATSTLRGARGWTAGAGPATAVWRSVVVEVSVTGRPPQRRSPVRPFRRLRHVPV